MKKILILLFVAFFFILSCEKEKPEPDEDEKVLTFIDDRDGNEYEYVKIGNQYWMAENLAYLPKVDKPRDGFLPTSGDTARFFVYGYDGLSVEEAKSTPEYTIFGVLYNWLAITCNDTITTSKKHPDDSICPICPEGWHVPTVEEWGELFDTLRVNEAFVSHQLMDTLYWYMGAEINYGPTFNTSGFSALPGGFMYPGTFLDKGQTGYFATSTSNEEPFFIVVKFLFFENRKIGIFSEFKNYAVSVRCVKD